MEAETELGGPAKKPQCRWVDQAVPADVSKAPLTHLALNLGI